MDQAIVRITSSENFAMLYGRIVDGQGKPHAGGLNFLAESRALGFTYSFRSERSDLGTILPLNHEGPR